MISTACSNQVCIKVNVHFVMELSLGDAHGKKQLFRDHLTIGDALTLITLLRPLFKCKPEWQSSGRFKNKDTKEVINFSSMIPRELTSCSCEGLQ